MAGLCAISLDGVLRAEIGAAPIPEGINLYQSLVSMYRMCVVLDNTEAELAAMWLRKEGLRDYVQLHVRRPLDDRVTQYRRLQAQGPVELIVSPDPEVVAGALGLGITSMLFAHPRAQRPEWRADYARTPKPWDRLVEQVERQRTLED